MWLVLLAREHGSARDRDVQLFPKKDRVAPLLFVYHATTRRVCWSRKTTRPSACRSTTWADRVQRCSWWNQDKSGECSEGSTDQHVIVYSDTPDADRVILAGALHRNLTVLTVIQPSLTDRLAHAINPRHNRAHTAVIYTSS